MAVEGDRIIQSEAVVSAVRFTADGKLAGLCDDNTIRVWDPRSGQLQRTETREKSDRAAALLDSGLYSAVASDGSVKIVDPRAGRETRRTKPLGYKGGRLGVAPDYGKFATVSRIDPTAIDEQIQVWDTEGKSVFTAPSGFGGASAFAFSPDGQTAVLASYDANVRAWSTRNGELQRLIDELPVSMFAAAFSPDGRTLALAGADRTVYLYETRSWKLARKIAPLPEMISSLAFSPDSRLIATGGFDVVTVKNPVHVILWEAQSGRQVRAMNAPHQVRSVAFAPDGTLGANVNSDKTVSVWSVPKA